MTQSKEVDVAIIGAGPDLKSVLSMAELSRRPSRPPDHAAENRALNALMQELATSPHSILRKLVETAMAMCRSHSAGISLLNDDKRAFTGPQLLGSGPLTRAAARRATTARAARSWTAMSRSCSRTLNAISATSPQ
jgi:hypothetical protein